MQADTNSAGKDKGYSIMHNLRFHRYTLTLSAR
jgi:hypothetical protein